MSEGQPREGAGWREKNSSRGWSAVGFASGKNSVMIHRQGVGVRMLCGETRRHATKHPQRREGAD